MMNAKLILIVLMSTFVIAGCGGDGDENSGGGESAATIPLNVDAATPASDMTDDEASEFCSSAYKAFSQTAESLAQKIQTSLCPLEGVMAGEDVFWDDGSDNDIVDACESAVSECEDTMASTDGEWEEEGTSEEEFCDDIESTLGSCDVTIGELVDCLNAVNDMVVDVADTLFDVPSCRKLNNDYYFNEDESTSAEELDMPSECETVFEKCPEMEDLAASTEDL